MDTLDKNPVECKFTTADGFITFVLGTDMVTVKFLDECTGKRTEIRMPAYKFDWAVKDFKSYVMPANK